MPIPDESDPFVLPPPAEDDHLTEGLPPAEEIVPSPAEGRPRDSQAPDATSASEEEVASSAELTSDRVAAQFDATPHADRVAAVIYNPIKVDLELLKSTVASAEETAGWGTTIWFETSEEDPGGLVTKEAIAAGAYVVMAAGGDGTVRAVAESLRGSGIPIALLPSGTGNLLARNLELTLDNLPESITAAFTGGDRKIDLGVVDVERAGGKKEKFVFLVMAGLGLDAKMIAHTNEDLKKRVGWLAYVDAIGKALRDKDRLNIRFSIDGSPTRSARVHTILVGNCGSLQGNILLLPDAAVDDGVFDIVALRPEGFFGWLQIWTKIVWENGVLRRSSVGRKIVSLTKEVRVLRYVRGTELKLRLDREEEFELDGDGFGKAVAIRALVDPLALTVKVPAEG